MFKPGSDGNVVSPALVAAAMERSTATTLEFLGAEKESNSESGMRYKVAGAVYSLWGAQAWKNWETGTSGRGAISLYCDATGAKFQAAVLALVGGDIVALDKRPIQRTEVAVVKAVLRKHDTTAWPAVREYLVKARNLPGWLVDQARMEGQVLATAYQGAANVVFQYGPHDQEWRAASVDSSRRGMYRGHTKAVPFILAGDDPEGALAVCEGAISALSYKAIFGNQDTVLAVGGAGNAGIALPYIRRWLDAGRQVLLATDNDTAGDDAYQTLDAAAPGVERQNPGTLEDGGHSGANDWNDVLTARHGKLPL